MLITIYFNENSLIIQEAISEKSQINNTLPSDSIFLNPSEDQIKVILQKLQNSHIDKALILTTNFSEIQDFIFKQYTIIEAAGGIIENQQKELLFIFRRGKWDLPKGKLEKGETPEIGAQREIQEETGATDLLLQKKIMNTYHVYQMNDENILKIGHWFAFYSNTRQLLQPQLEEEITAVEWFHVNDVNIPLSNTYGTIQELIKQFLKEN